jgi:Cytochrome C and Quinol oxidase polypeptide I
VTTVAPKPIVTRPWPVHQPVRGSAFARLLRTTDAKQIGLMYLVTSMAYFIIGGFMALLMRAELAKPGLQFLSTEQYNQLFTMHGTIMLLFFATPILFAFANYIVPLQIGAPDVSFPRLNALAYWLYLFGSGLALAGFITPDGAADFGWFAYAPLNSVVHSPGVGADMWIVGLAISGLGTILGGVNMITTILTLRAPGMTMFRMPIFTWNIMITSLMVLLVFPILAAALLALLADRQLGAHVYDSQTGGPLLWQHLFWFFGHPEVYIVALPFFGIVTEVIPVFSRKPLFGYKGMVAATIGIAGLSMTVWAHHMFVTGQVLLPFFSFLTFLIAVPTGIKFFNWIGTMWRGQLSFEAPMLWALGFMTTFLFGGLSGGRLPRLRLVLRGGPLPLRALRHDRVRRLRWYLLLVPEGHRPDVRRAPGEGALLVDVHRLPHHVPDPALARHPGHAPPVRRLPGQRRLHPVQHDLHDRRLHPRLRDAAVPVQHVEVVYGRSARRGGRPVGPRQLAGVGDVLPAAAAQLRPDAADPLRAAGIRPEVPGVRAGRPGRGAGGWRQAAHRRGPGWRHVRGGHVERAVTAPRSPSSPKRAGFRAFRQAGCSLRGRSLR